MKVVTRKLKELEQSQTCGRLIVNRKKDLARATLKLTAKSYYKPLENGNIRNADAAIHAARTAC